MGPPNLSVRSSIGLTSTLQSKLKRLRFSYPPTAPAAKRQCTPFCSPSTMAQRTFPDPAQPTSVSSASIGSCPVVDPPRPCVPATPFNSNRPNLVSSVPAVPLPPASNYRLLSDTLGKLAMASAEMLDSGMSFSTLCIRHRGPSCLADPSSIPHRAAPLLTALWHHGATAAQGTANWPLAKLDDAASRGPHRSTNEHVEFMRQGFSEMVRAGQWLVLPYSSVRNLPNLRLSPTGVVPQRDRRPRPIIDYSYSGVNAATISNAPDSIQFGNAFNRFLQRLQRADTRNGPIYTSVRQTSPTRSCRSGFHWTPSQVSVPFCPHTKTKSP
jgi:hypothetical protein